MKFLVACIGLSMGLMACSPARPIAPATSAPATPAMLPAEPTPAPTAGAGVVATPTVEAASTATPAATVAVTSTAVTSTDIATTTTATTPQLVSLLKAGGYVIYFRHALTDRTQTDSDLSTCQTQRNLNAQGIQEATAIGRALQQLGVPVGRVVASPYCRTQDTARLMFGEGNFEVVDSYSDIIAFTRETLNAVYTDTENLVIVSHGMPITSIANITIAEGEAAIFKPRGNGDQGLVGRVLPAQWEEWASQTVTEVAAPVAASLPVTQVWDTPAGTYAHDVAVGADGIVWWTAQGTGELGRFDPATGQHTLIKIAERSAPHGVVMGPDGAPWVTDGGANAVARIDPQTQAVKLFPLPEGTPSINMNTGTFDNNGVFWFTGQAGYYGSVNPQTGEVKVYEAPRGRGAYGITTTPQGRVFYASLAGSHIAEIDVNTGTATPIDPPTPGQGARRVWSDSQGRIWVSEWNAGQVGVYDPATQQWQEWPLPNTGRQPQTYAVYVDERDGVWLSDFGNNSVVRFDPATEQFTTYPMPSPGANVRQILGRPGEVWLPLSGSRELMVIRTGG